MSAIQTAEFEVRREEIIRELQSWWDEESLSFDEAVEGARPRPSDDGLGKVPVVDSKAVIRASGIVQRQVGVKLPPKLIRKGGYFSFDDFLADMLPKLHGLCSDAKTQDQATQQRGH